MHNIKTYIKFISICLYRCAYRDSNCCPEIMPSLLTPKDLINIKYLQSFLYWASL